MSYAIVWSEYDEPGYAGKLELTSAAVLLSGNELGPPEARSEFRFDDLAVSLERCACANREMGAGARARDPGGSRVVIGSLEGLGALQELADDVAGRSGAAAS